MRTGRTTRLVDDLLSLHDATAKSRGAIARAFGDGYLLVHNPVFARVRHRTLGAGFRYSDRPPYRYAVLQLFTLGKALSSKVLPYRENVAVLRDLVRERPRTFTLQTLFDCGLWENRTLHESGHALASLVLDPLPARAKTLTRRETTVLKLEMAEAFANAIERYACYYKRTTNDRAFWPMNANFGHVSYEEVRPLYELLGEREAFLFELLASLASFFLVQEATPRAMASMLEGFVRPLRGDDLTLVHAHFANRLKLNLHFRTKITEAYLHYVGLRGSVFELLDFDWAKVLREDERWRGVPSALTDLVMAEGASSAGKASSTRRTSPRKSAP